MMRNKSKQISSGILYLALFITGLCMGILLFCGIHLWQNRADRAQKENGMSPNGTEVVLSGHKEAVSSENTKIAERETPASEATEIAVNYPFSYGMEDWSLVLRENGKTDMSEGELAERNFCLYDGNGQLLQEFPCGIAEEELVFRFDTLFSYYGYDADLIVFPADAKETGAEGVCYPWNHEEKKFTEESISIPWYQEDSVKDQAFLTVTAEENGENDTICRINEGSREVVELRKWTLHKKEETGEEILHIWDCLEQQDLYYGKVERNDLGNPVNDKYYQYLFWSELPRFWSWENDRQIETEKYIQGDIEKVVYTDKEALLADCGFAGKEPFYEDYDKFHNLILELYFDPQTEQGCGIRYGYHYNYELEKVVRYEGFVFDEVERQKWEPEDIFSTLSIEGTDARKEDVSGYSENCQYTDEGRLSYFESRGTVMDYGEDGPGEETLLSMDYYYRDDGTLYYKEYGHHHILFGTAYQWQCSEYDEQERLVYRSAYITHGTLEYFYIYDGDSLKPSYCLEFDYGGSPPMLVAYEDGDGINQ